MVTLSQTVSEDVRLSVEAKAIEAVQPPYELPF